MADAGYLSVRVIQRFFSKNLHFCACAQPVRVIYHVGNRPENTRVDLESDTAVFTPFALH